MVATKRIAVRIYFKFDILSRILLLLYSNHSLILSVFDCTSNNKKFLCADNATCLPIEKACNKVKDCSDGLDEGGICDKFSNNTACEVNNCPDNAECFIWPTGPVCVCPTGYSYNSQKKICEVRKRFL